MIVKLSIVVLFVGLLAVDLTASAQPPFGNNGRNLSRLPNDQIEGSIWEYKGTLKKKPQSGERAKIEGKFRLEDEAIFDVGSRLRLPPRKEIEKKIVRPLIEGRGIDLKIPAGPQQKRLGEYHKISGGRIRLDFDDEESLHGIMIMTRKKNTSDVWIGTYKEMENKRTVREYSVEMKQIED